MPTYVYETVPAAPGDEPVRFEVVQSMQAAPLVRHPDTGAPVRRVISGGYGVIQKAGAKPITTAAPCRSGCACHSGPRIPGA
jgi:predicted nucleic acid-binding Zn ribbon protein